MEFLCFALLWRILIPAFVAIAIRPGKDAVSQAFFCSQLLVLNFAHLVRENRLIRVSKQEHLPAEFLYQGEHEAPRNNSDAWIARALAFNDFFSASKRIRKIQTTLTGFDGGPDIIAGLSHSFGKLGLTCAAEPCTVPAKVLNPPLLEFKGGIREPSIPDGSWQMKGKRFVNASYIYNYAVIQHPHVSDRDMQDLFRQMGQACQSTGIGSANCALEDWSKVKTELPSDPVTVRRRVCACACL